MSWWRGAATILAMMAAASAAGATAVQAASFSFVALGDTAYRTPRDYPRYQALARALNDERPTFAIHVGDFKGYSDCGDAAYREQVTRFRWHDHALILTPGDNDWADCDGDGLDRLAALRRIFYPDAASLGARPMPLDRQVGYPENARWRRDGVIFTTLHVVGPANNLVATDVRLAGESVARTAATRAWLKQTFAEAERDKAPAVVVAFQVDAFLPNAPVYDNGPLAWLRDTLREEAAKFPGQVLIVHGDSHRFIVDQPFRRADIEAGSTSGMNVVRVQVPGWPDHRAVRIDVDTSRPEVFAFRPVYPAAEATGAKP